MLKVDLHMHTSFSPDCLIPPEKLVARCQQVGLNCIAVTDHNTIQGALAMRALAPFTVIIGEEIKTTEGEVAGLFLQETIPAGLSPQETAQRIKEQGGLVSLPHPFDPFRRSALSPQGLEAVLPYTDILEAFNARNFRARDNARAHRLALERQLLVSAVSDAHALRELGNAYVEMPEFDGTPEGFKQALAQGRIVGRRTSLLLRMASSLNKVIKRFSRDPSVRSG